MVIEAGVKAAIAAWKLHQEPIKKPGEKTCTRKGKNYSIPLTSFLPGIL
ncbi:MAG: hypothetical protein NW220_13330 [Leptolyngbyaceae cyanobacterium bins.349]|nr:hypothetical protein [Leptolyngbyaceae cyanobacterium bins.349]